MTLILDRSIGNGLLLAYCIPDISGRHTYVTTVEAARLWARRVGYKPLQWCYADDRLAQQFVAE